MSQRQWHTLGVALALLLSALWPSWLMTQTQPRHKGFGWQPGDTMFLIGNHDIGNPKHFHDTLRLDFGQMYERPVLLTDSTDPVYIKQIADAYNTGVDGYKFYFTPSIIRHLVESCHRVEYYVASWDSLMQYYHFDGFGSLPQDSSVLSKYGIIALNVGTFTTGPKLLNERVFGTVRGLQPPYGYFPDLVEQWRPNVDSAHRPYDSIDYFQVGLTLRVNIAMPAQWPNDTVLAKAYLYRRVDTLQHDTGSTGLESCDCAIFDVFDSVVITKGNYQAAVDSAVNPVNNLAYRDKLNSPYYEIGKPVNMVRYESGGIKKYQVLLGTAGWQNKGAGPQLPLGYDTNAACRSYCNSILDSLKAIGPPTGLTHFAVNDPAMLSTSSDLIIRVYSTGIVPLTFVRASLGTHMYEVLKRGDLDSAIDITYRDFYAPDSLQDMLRRVLTRFGTSDEPYMPEYRAVGYVATKMQDRMAAYGDTNAAGILNRPLEMTVNQNYDAVRLVTGDLDTARRKILHAWGVQMYPYKWWAPTAVTYANPAEMDTIATYKFYGLGNQDVTAYGHTMHNRCIMGNSISDYNYYTRITQLGGPDRAAAFGSFKDYRAMISANQDNGPMIPKLARAVDVAQFKYQTNPNFAPHPVWYVVQVHGSSGGIGFGSRTPTAEDITCQSFLGLNCGINSMMFSDFVDDGYLLGVMKNFDKGTSDQEYGKFEGWDTRWPYSQYDSLRIWTGFPGRYGAVKRIVDYFKDTLLPVYTKLTYNQEQMSVHDSARQAFADMPMLDTLLAERAMRDSVSFQPYASAQYDARSQTYMEVTHFMPGVYDTQGRAQGAHYLLMTNRRTWPIDFQTYDSIKVRHRMAASVQFAADSSDTVYSDTGLGNIDVRRPVIRLKNSTSVVADSFRIEKIGGGFTRIVHVDSLVALDWLTPGWGAMYRVTPIPAGVSQYGSAFNNAVRSEHPSTDAADRDQFFVYERDSLIFLRAVAANGAISQEWILSDPADLVDTTRGFNFNPTIASMRDVNSYGLKSSLALWERRDPAAKTTTIIGIFLETLPQHDSLPGRVRFPLTAPRSYIGGGFNQSGWMTPSLTGVNGGWVAAWASPKQGIEVKAISGEYPGTNGSVYYLASDGAYVGDLAAQDTSSTVIARFRPSDLPGGFLTTPDSTSFFPTLAYFDNRTSVVWEDGTHSATTDTGQGGDSTLADLQIAHLAYQQGKPSTVNTQYIMYNRVGVDFPAAPTPPKLWVSPTEHVSEGLAGCGFLHPSIAADSVRVGVAFQSNRWTDRLVTLRFRNTSRLDAVDHWRTPAYNWGSKSNGGSQTRYYEWPSLTHFPKMPPTQLSTLPYGALTWFRTTTPYPALNGPSEQWLYEYGQVSKSQLPNGEYPTLTLAPYRSGDAFAASSILYRGDTTTLSTGESLRGYTSEYYPLMLEHRPDLPSPLFTSGLRSDSIRAEFILRSFRGNDCNVAYVLGDGRLYADAYPVKNRPAPPAVDDAPALPMSFFATPGDGAPEIASLEAAAEVTRSSVFTAGGAPRYVSRRITGTDELLPWLNAAPLDFHGDSADVKILVELVRASNDEVLWNADTLSARAIGDSTVEDVVEVPVHTATTPETEVYIRMRAVASETLQYEVGAAFSFWEDTTQVSYQKVTRPRTRESALPGASISAIEAVVVPNPLMTRGELQLRLMEPGMMRAGIYDMLGRLVRELPTFDAAQPGEYALEMDLSALPRGMYTVQVEQGNNRASARFTVVR